MPFDLIVFGELRCLEPLLHSCLAKLHSTIALTSPRHARPAADRSGSIGMGRRRFDRLYGRDEMHKSGLALEPLERRERSVQQLPNAQYHSLLEMPRDMIEEVMLRLPYVEALALGSTCHALSQLLQLLRPTKLEQYLKSDELKLELAPKLQMKLVGQLCVSWTVRASRIIYQLMTKEKLPPDLIWDTIVPHIGFPGPKEYLSVCCTFGCLDWVSGSMRTNGGETFLYQHLAQSDLARLDSTFAHLQNMFVSSGIQESRVCIHLCKNEPDIGKQQDANLLVYWTDGSVQTKHVNVLD